jgi:hypothetical protein
MVAVKSAGNAWRDQVMDDVPFTVVIIRSKCPGGVRVDDHQVFMPFDPMLFA